MKINTSAIGHDISKELSEVQGNGFELENVTPLVERKQVKVGLLNALLGGQEMEVTLNTDTFKYDEVEGSQALPSGKNYNEFGDDVTKDKPRRLRYAVPSFGIRANVAPEDYAGRRKPGTSDQFLTEADVVAKMNEKMADAWGNFDELGLATLLTTDTNIVRGGPFEQYDYHNDILGAARGAKIDMDLTNTAIDHDQAFRKQRRLLTQDLEKAMDSASQIVCICGDTFFDKRYELQKNDGLARPIEFGLDLASQPINEDSFGSGTYNYAWFDGQDGIRYINYGASVIAGSKLIGDDDAYMIPVGATSIFRAAYAPARTREYVNTEALKRYGWSQVSDRRGVSMWQESNKLWALVNPQLIRHLTSS